jgi:hypothetical protein
MDVYQELMKNPPKIRENGGIWVSNTSKRVFIKLKGWTPKEGEESKSSSEGTLVPRTKRKLSRPGTRTNADATAPLFKLITPAEEVVKVAKLHHEGAEENQEEIIELMEREKEIDKLQEQIQLTYAADLSKKDL